MSGISAESLDRIDGRSSAKTPTAAGIGSIPKRARRPASRGLRFHSPLLERTSPLAVQRHRLASTTMQDLARNSPPRRYGLIVNALSSMNKL